MKLFIYIVFIFFVFSSCIASANILVKSGSYGIQSATSSTEDTIVGFSYEFDGIDCDVFNLTFHMTRTASQPYSVMALVYDYDTDALLANSSVYVLNTAGGLYRFTLDTPVSMVNGEKYWLCLWSNLSVSWSNGIYYESAGTGTSLNRDSEVWDATPPAVWSNTSIDADCDGTFYVEYYINTTENLIFVNSTGTFEHNKGGYWVNASGNWSHYVTSGDVMLEPSTMVFVIWLLIAIVCLYSKSWIHWFVGGLLLLMYSYYTVELLDYSFQWIYSLVTVFIVILAWLRTIGYVLSKRSSV
ncbi:MAG: hypothetical protein H7836_11405 [Magnetococcus sp. YQC-3]